MNRRICQIICYLSALFSVAAAAHEDTIITLRNGELIGLPDKYQPAYLNLQKKSLQIGINHFHFPPCVSKYFPDDNQYDITIKSSWYHDLSLLPPYLVISIQPKGKDYSFDLIFGMDTLKLFFIWKVIRQSDGETSIQGLVIDEFCRKSIEKSYTKMKP